MTAVTKPARLRLAGKAKPRPAPAVPRSKTPKLRIAIRDGLTVFTSVLINDEQWPITRVRFDTGESFAGLVDVELHVLMDVEVTGMGAVDVTPVYFRGWRGWLQSLMRQKRR